MRYTVDIETDDLQANAASLLRRLADIIENAPGLTVAQVRGPDGESTATGRVIDDAPPQLKLF